MSKEVINHYAEGNKHFRISSDINDFTGGKDLELCIKEWENDLRTVPHVFPSLHLAYQPNLFSDKVLNLFRLRADVASVRAYERLALMAGSSTVVRGDVVEGLSDSEVTENAQFIDVRIEEWIDNYRMLTDVPMMAMAYSVAIRGVIAGRSDNELNAAMSDDFRVSVPTRVAVAWWGQRGHGSRKNKPATEDAFKRFVMKYTKDYHGKPLTNESSLRTAFYSDDNWLDTGDDVEPKNKGHFGNLDSYWNMDQAL
jgi:hypothetical protein